MVDPETVPDELSAQKLELLGVSVAAKLEPVNVPDTAPLVLSALFENTLEYVPVSVDPFWVSVSEVVPDPNTLSVIVPVHVPVNEDGVVDDVHPASVVRMTTAARIRRRERAMTFLQSRTTPALGGIAAIRSLPWRRTGAPYHAGPECLNGRKTF